MHAAALRVFRSAQRSIVLRGACRIIGGARRPLAHRNFHRSAILYQAPQAPSPPAEGDKEEPDTEESRSEAEEENGGENPPDATEDGVPEKSTIEPEILSTPRQGKKSVGRTVRGTARIKQPEGVPPVVLPDWFWLKNVKCIGDPDLSGSLAVYASTECNLNGQPGQESAVLAEAGRQIEDVSNCGLLPTPSAKYSMHVYVYKEILTTLRAGLALSPPKNVNSKSLVRPITVLQCPKDGGSYYLDSVIETIAGKLDADLVRLDSQDIAQLIGSYTDENNAWSLATNTLLAYNAHKAAGKTEDFDKEATEENGEEDEEQEEIDRISALTSKVLGRVRKGDPRRPQMATFAFADTSQFMRQIKKDDESFSQFDQQNNQADMWNDLKLTTVLDSLVNAADEKRAKIETAVSASNPEDSSVDDKSDSKSKGIIIQVKDYNEIMKTPEGPRIMSRLRSSVDKKWQKKRNIILVGTTTTIEEADPALSKPDIQHLQSDIVDGEKRTIYVPHDRREDQDTAFETDEKARIRRINVRHVEDMISKLVDGTQHLTPLVDLEKDMDSAVAFSAGLEDSVWNFPRVHRIAITILGLENSQAQIDGVVFGEALKLLASADQAKFSWGASEVKDEDESAEVLRYGGNDGDKKKAMDKIKELKKKCNTYEKKLLSGVIFPSDIRVTFGDIRAPKETIEALQTLTSLSLLRPDAFSYGVLATDKIPGLLLYGPPGTGKTLLAKAVAKESGATVLEITAADLNDMFVGQGEKNVRAVFTLAKKLAPCVVFLDEADAIFSARSHHNRNAHREMINQFLREWDGMTTDLSAFIMLATNRPFDLDEAVLRRLPRRLLIDLPVEKDREAILKIHLKDEILDPAISLTKLAQDTPFYSGSDLKNVSVAAALACVREENAAAAAHVGEETYVYPEKRTLTAKHFEKALEEISASISEDMSTLTAIRKFDEKYGDRKGRKKKGPGLGFGGTKAPEKDSEAAMVRKLEV